MVDVFVSHARNDDPIVDQIDGEFVANQIETWIDHKNLEYGHQWEAEIDAALEQCNCGLVVLSNYSIRSRYSHNEWNKMIDMGKERVFVLKIQDIPQTMIPTSLYDIQYADLVPYLNDESRDVMDKLIRQIKSACCNPAPQPTLILETSGDVDLRQLAQLLDTLSNEDLQELMRQLQNIREEKSDGQD